MMKQFSFPFCLLAFLFAACSSNNQKPETDIETARVFIKNIHENKFKDAEQLVLKEEANKQYFDLFEKHFTEQPKNELEQYKNADIIINEITPVNDSVTIINYSNSYKKAEKNKLKLVHTKDGWLVDLKYTFSGNL